MQKSVNFQNLLQSVVAILTGLLVFYFVEFFLSLAGGATGIISFSSVTEIIFLIVGGIPVIFGGFATSSLVKKKKLLHTLLLVLVLITILYRENIIDIKHNIKGVLLIVISMSVFGYLGYLLEKKSSLKKNQEM